MVNIPLDRCWVAAFCKKWQISELALFGSVLGDDFCPNSDVDVLVTFVDNAPWSLLDLVTLRDELSEQFGRPVDVVEKKAIRNPYRRRHILANHEVIHAA